MRVDQAAILRIAPMLLLAMLGLGVSCLIACGHAGGGGESSDSMMTEKRSGYGGY
jgi:hypothetical protein